MIINVPTPSDFIESGTDFLNLAWEPAIMLSIEWEEAQKPEWGLDLDEQSEAAYWKAAQRELATATSLVQQGTEFLLKGEVAKISPYLLISGSPREWLSKCDKIDTPFSDFKTIDAQDLIKVYDAVVQKRLPNTFRTKFEDLRKLRNTIMHTVGKDIQITAKEVIVSILETCHCLIGPANWISLRRQFLGRKPSSVTSDDLPEFTQCTLTRELTTLVRVLKPSDTKKYFGYDKKQREFICPHCEGVCSDYGIETTLAQLRPNLPNSTTVYCLACGTETKVVRQNCGKQDCKSNVIDEATSKCLICGSYNRND